MAAEAAWVTGYRLRVTDAWARVIRAAKRAGPFRPTPRGGSSAYHLGEVCHRRRFLMSAKNHAVATRRLPGQIPRAGRIEFSSRISQASICQPCGWRAVGE